MNLVLWIIAGVLAALFGAAGILKLTMSREVNSRSGSAWVEDFSTGTVKAIGALELLAALALMLPAAFGTATFLTPLAALGLVLLMAGAILVHLRRHEPQLAAGAGLLLILAAMVAWGRFGPYPL